MKKYCDKCRLRPPEKEHDCPFSITIGCDEDKCNCCKRCYLVCLVEADNEKKNLG